MKNKMLSILSFACLLGGWMAFTRTTAPKMLDLPVTPEARAMAYTFCLCNDQAATIDLLAQRIKYAGGKNPKKDATSWVKAGYCKEFLAKGESLAPTLRADALKLFAENGFEEDEPVTSQAKAGKKGLGKLIKGIGNLLGKIFTGGGAGGNGTYIEYSKTGADGSSESFSYCDRSWNVGQGKGTAGGTANPSDPPPFNPELPNGGR